MHRVIRGILIALLVAPFLLAQRDLGTFTGVVTDPSGAVITGARVTFNENATGQSYSTLTDESGTYVRPLLKAGTYTVEVEAAGFSKAVQRDVVLSGGARVGVNIQMTVGDVSQTLEVAAMAPLLQTESTVVGQNLTSRTVSELPLGGSRKFSFLARLSPGVVPGEPNGRDQGGGGFSANGVGSSGHNNYLLNGVDNNNNVVDMQGGHYVVTTPLDAIGEMRILINGYNAEYGRGAGGVIDVTLKSGTNEFHGSVFEYLQNDKLNSNKWETNKAGAKKPPFRQNQFGGSVGGPIVRNRTFFFADYQGTRIRSTGGIIPGLGSAPVLIIPRPEMKNGDFSSLLGRVLGTDGLGRSVAEGQIFDITTTQRLANGLYVRDPFPGNIIPANRFDPVAKRLIDQFPTPNQNLGLRVPTANYFTVTQGTEETDQGDLRIDHRITDKDSLFGSLSWSEDYKNNSAPLPGALDARSGPEYAKEDNLARNAMLSYTRTWKPNLLTETRLAYSRLISARAQGNADVDMFKEYGIRGYNPSTPVIGGGLPLIQAQGYSRIGPPDWQPSVLYSNTWDFIQNVSIVKGRHALKFGFESKPTSFPYEQFDGRRGRLNFNRDRNYHPDPRFQGSTGDGMAALLLGFPSLGDIGTANFVSSQREAYAFFGQTDWKVTPKLTLNLGVRYELFSPISERFGRQARLDYETLTLEIPRGKDQDTPLAKGFPVAFPNVKVSRGQVSKYLIPWDKSSIAPRFGLAYALQPKTVIRLGYGIFYSSENNQGGSPNRGKSVPFNTFTILSMPRDRTDFDFNPYFNRLADGFPLDVFDVASPVRWQSVAKNFRNGLVHKWNVAIQRELPWDTALEVSYIGNKQQHLPTGWDINTAPARPDIPAGTVSADSLRPIPELASVSSFGYSFGYGNYAALAGKFEKRFSRGLQFVTAYTWGHALSSVGAIGLFGNEGGWAARGNPRDANSRYSDAGYDIRHNFTTGFLWELPFGTGRAFGANMGRAADLVIGGWQMNGIVSLRTGNPYTLATRFGVGFIGTAHPDLVAGKDPQAAPASGRVPEQWFDTAAVARPVPYTDGTIGNQTMRRPGQRNLDLSLFKEFKATERFRVQFRAESFNLTNTPFFGKPGHTQGDGDFGLISTTNTGSQRQIQLALRLLF